MINDEILQTKNKVLKELKLSNIMATPQIKKIVINVGFGSILGDKKAQEVISENLKKITGQSPSETKAKKAISSFKIREGQVVGARVTLRGKKMNAFFKKLVTVVLTRVRDFRGVSKESFDGNGNYTLGFREVSVFPEIEFSRGEKQFGLEITIQTSAKTDEEAKKLLEITGLPFKKIDNKGRGE